VFRELFTGLAFPVPTVAQDHLAVSWLQVCAVRAVLSIAGLAVIFCEVWYLAIVTLFLLLVPLTHLAKPPDNDERRRARTTTNKDGRGRRRRQRRRGTTTTTKTDPLGGPRDADDDADPPVAVLDLLTP
jgi:hypothetical protein